MRPHLAEAARELEVQLIAWFRETHIRPEVGFPENRTATLIASSLRDLRIEVKVGIGGTGVVGRLGHCPPAFLGRLPGPAH